MGGLTHIVKKSSSSTRLPTQTANPDCDPIATDPVGRMKQVLRHEIVHAFLNESGLVYNSNFSMQGWATNEEMVDWIAWNGEKLHKAWKEAGLVD